MYTMKFCKHEDWDEGHMAAVSDIDGSYIGTKEFAEELKSRGIAAQKSREENEVASIGFCEKEQKWYGWSHRAIFGFGIGSTVSKGDCAYVPVDWDDFIESSINFWKDDWHNDVRGKISKNEYGDVVLIEWVYSQETPNEKIRGKVGYAFMYPPNVWGKGEWTAKTLNDAKQMAKDYAESVS